MYPTIEKFLPKKDREIFKLKGKFTKISHQSSWRSLVVGKVTTYHFEIEPHQIPQKKFTGIRGREIPFPTTIEVEKPKGSRFQKQVGEISEITVEYSSKNDQYFFGQKAFSISIDGVLETSVD